MKTLEELANLALPEAYENFLHLCATPEETQRTVLIEIISANAECEFGANHDFAKIATPKDYKNRVPISSWNEYENLCEKMRNGKENVLFNGQAQAFISTSGTSGRPKLIPESANGALAKNVTDKLRRRFTFGAHTEISQGKILPLVNAATIGKTPCGIPFGTASGLTLKSAPPALLATCAYPISTLTISDDYASDYVLMRFAIENGVRLIIGNNIARMEKLATLAADNAERMIRDIDKGTIDIPEGQLGDSELELRKKAIPNPERARDLRRILESGRPFIPSEYWSELKVVCCWLSGTVGASVRGVEKLFGDKVEYLDYGYGASEGKFNIPSKPGKSAGTLAIHAGFYEFIPVDSDSNSTGTLLAHQLVDGEKYRLIITNHSGLYRYDMKDIVKVCGFTGKTPNIVFVSKYGDIGNAAGEKLAGSTIAKAAGTAGERMGLNVTHIVAIPRTDQPRYELCVELESDSPLPDPAKLADALDVELKKDIGYRNKRKDNLLRPPNLIIMRQGWLDAIYESKNASGSAKAQIKLPVIYNAVPLPEFIA